MHEARKAQERGEVPVGAVLVDADGTVLASAGNRGLGTTGCSIQPSMLPLSRV